MPRGSKTRRRGNSVSVNFKDAELRNFLGVEGNFNFKITKAEENDDGTSIVMTAEVIDEGKAEGKTVTTFFNLQPQSLWKLVQFLEAIGEEVPDDEADLDLDEWVDKEFNGDVAKHDYNEKTYFRISNFFPADEAEEPKAASKKSSKKAEPEEEEDEDEKPAKRGRGRPAGSKNKPRYEEEDEKPAKKAKKEKSLPKLTEEEVKDMSEEELDDLVQKYELECDLEEARTLRKKAALVIDELETKDLLETD
jgi:hypothetical protein